MGLAAEKKQQWALTLYLAPYPLGEKKPDLSVDINQIYGLRPLVETPPQRGKETTGTDETPRRCCPDPLPLSLLGDKGIKHSLKEVVETHCSWGKEQEK